MKRWRGPSFRGEFPTLGHQVIDWIEEWCVIPDGDRVGERFLLTDEMQRHTLWHYRLTIEGDPSPLAPGVVGGRWSFERGSQLVRPQKWGKGPYSASHGWVEALGPVVFDGWDANGDPVGREWPNPLIQVTAMSQDQTDNIWLPMLSMGREGPIINELAPDIGETRIVIPKGGRIEPTTSAGTSRLGNPIKCSLQDESHSATTRNGGIKLFQTQRRNLAGMGGRFLETTNGWDITEASMAQLSNETPVGMFVNYPDPPPGSVKNKRERRKVLRSVYGDSLTSRGGWVDLDRIDAEIESLLPTDPAQAERFFLNRKHAGSSKAFDLAAWNLNADPDYQPADGALITVGVDGARFDDALAIVGTEVETGFQWPIRILQRPAFAPDDYEHDFVDADGAMVDVFERFEPWRVYIDPQRIEVLVNKWQGRWGQDRILEWFTNRPKPICYAVRNYKVGISSGDFRHSGDPLFTEHVGNAVRKKENVKDEDGRPLHSVCKIKPGSHLKIDAAVAGVISYEARNDAIAAGAKSSRRRWVAPVRMR